MFTVQLTICIQAEDQYGENALRYSQGRQESEAESHDLIESEN